MRRLVALGFPAAAQLLLEVGVFALSTILAGRLLPAELAAHQVTITLASLTYMVPLGLSSAAAVRVGQGLGRGEPAAAARAGWTALLLGTGFMGGAAVVFFVVPGLLIRLFTVDTAVLTIGVPLLYAAAVFQLFDGAQVVAIGALRGAGDTRTPLLWNLIGYWLLALPIGWYLCFREGLGALGLWIGFCVGLIVVAVVLLAVWARRARAWVRQPAR